MERLKQPVEFHLIAISCSFSRLSKAVTIVTAVKGRRSGFGLKRFLIRLVNPTAHDGDTQMTLPPVFIRWKSLAICLHSRSRWQRTAADQCSWRR